MLKRKKNPPLFFSLLILFFPYLIKGQEPGKTPSDSAYYCSFYPMHVGDKWVYKTDYGDGDAFYYYYEIVMDTVDSLNRHWFGWKYGDSGEIGFYTITDSFEVVYGFPDSNVTNVLYKLNAKPGDKWLIYGDYECGIVFEVDTIYDYGNGVRVMKIDEWNWDNYERTLWSSSRFLKTGFGMVETWWEAGPVEYLMGAIIDGIVYGNPNEISQEKLSIISNFHLYQNYPNPFNLYTTIPFYLDHIGIVELNIYDLLGRVIFTKKSSYQIGGYHQFRWNGLNNKAEPVSSGIYIYELSTDENKKRMKMTVNK
jgi:hypothetical protein